MRWGGPETEVQGIIADEDASYMVVYGPKNCKIIDIRKTTTDIIKTQKIVCKEGQFIQYMSIESDYLVSVIKAEAGATPFQLSRDKLTLELRKIKNFKGQIDFVQIPIDCSDGCSSI